MVEARMIKMLEKSDFPSPANPTLGFLNQEQLQEVESKMTPSGRMNKVIDYLLEVEDKYFECFCKILKECGFEGKAEMLRSKAKECKEYYGKFKYKQHTCKHQLHVS